MPSYRTRDLLLVPNVLSAARGPLALVFPFAIGHVWSALAVLGAAALTDVLDGFLARRWNQATPLGALVDGIADKVFGASVVVTLVVSGGLAPVLALLLATREIGELPLALRCLVNRSAREAVADRRANAFGKLATTLELATVVAVIVGVGHIEPLVFVTAGLGLVAAATYWTRELRAPAHRQPVRAYAP